MKIRRSILSLSCLLLGLSLRVAPAADSKRFDSSTLKCGPAALYVFLVMCGREDVSFSQLDDIPIGPSGASMLSLKQAAAKVNVDTEIRTYRPQEIEQVPLPAISAFRWWGHDALPDHYLVIHKVDDEMVHLVDGLYAQEVHFPRSRLANSWAGVALIRKQSHAPRLLSGWSSWYLPMLVVLDIALLAYFAHRSRVWWRFTLKSDVP